jgi:translation initiation factor 1 (eIF-1/SUI1)
MAKPTDDEDEAARPLSHNPFAKLTSLRDRLPEGEAPKRQKRPPPTAMIRLQQLGSEEREITAIGELGLSEKRLSNLLDALREDLGCKGTIEEGVIYLQGDQRERLSAVLPKRGVTRFTFA